MRPTLYFVVRRHETPYLCFSPGIWDFEVTVILKWWLWHALVNLKQCSSDRKWDHHIGYMVRRLTCMAFHTWNPGSFFNPCSKVINIVWISALSLLKPKYCLILIIQFHIFKCWSQTLEDCVRFLWLLHMRIKAHVYLMRQESTKHVTSISWRYQCILK